MNDNKDLNLSLHQKGYLRLLSKELQGLTIRSVSNTPFDKININRIFEIGSAYQIKKVIEYDDSDKRIDVYIEPFDLRPGNRVVFTENIPEKNIKKGDKGEILRINSNNTLDVETDNRTYIRNLFTTACVYDADYKFVQFAKIHTAGQKYFSVNPTTNSGFQEESHWENAQNPIVCSVRYEGDLTPEKEIAIRELFEKFFPGAKKAEESGKYSFLLLSEQPYSRSKKVLNLDEIITNKIRPKLK